MTGGVREVELCFKLFFITTLFINVLEEGLGEIAYKRKINGEYNTIIFMFFGVY